MDKLNLEIGEEFYINFYDALILIKIISLPYKIGSTILFDIERFYYNMNTRDVKHEKRAYSKGSLKSYTSRAITYFPRHRFIDEIFTR